MLERDSAVSKTVEISMSVAVALPGDLTVPSITCGVVLFAHGSGSSRLSPRNRAVARSLNDAGLATLLFDLLTDEESWDRRLVFDVARLAARLEAATDWALRDQDLQGLPLGFFGASTGAGAALWAAADMPGRVMAIVSRGGRPDLAGPRLSEVRAPTLLIVGGRDSEVLALNEAARRRMTCPSRLEVVPGATHLFEEPGALEQVAGLASNWFVQHFSTIGAAR